MLTALLLVLPVSWVYMLTKQRSGYDQSVVQTVIILPMTVAATVILVQNSLALAFTLAAIDRKSTRLNSSHSQISYAVFCLKKKKKTLNLQTYDLAASSYPTSTIRSAVNS